MKTQGQRIIPFIIVFLLFFAFIPSASADSVSESHNQLTFLDKLNISTIKNEEANLETSPTVSADPEITPEVSTTQPETSPTVSADPEITPEVSTTQPETSPTPTPTSTPTPTPTPILDSPTPLPEETLNIDENSIIVKSTTPGWGVDQAGNPCYYLDTIGTKVTNYFYVSGKLYYAYPSTGVAIRTRGWFTRHDGVRCYAFDGGWLTPARFTDNNNDYYVNYGGTLIANQYMNISGKYYYAGHDGVIKKNGFFTRTDGVVCYAAGADGAIQMSSSMVTISGNVYYIQTAGVVAKNQYFLDSGSNLRYVQADGTVIVSRGWFVRADGVSCYAWTNGILIPVRFTDTNGNDYYVNYGGTVIAGQYMNISGSLYYAGHDGAIKPSGYFKRDDGVICYAAGDDGAIVPAWVIWDDGSCHSVNEAGNLVNMTIRRSLLIGNADYVGTANDLKAPTRDAAAMERALSGSTFYFNNGYRTTIRTNQTAANMKSLLGSVFSGASENDISLFFYSGHGIVGGTNAGAIIGIDGTLVTPAQVKSILDGIPGRKIIFIDACGSGAFVKSVTNGEIIKPSEMTASEKAAAIKSFNDAWANTFSSSIKSGEFANKVGSPYTVITACDDDEYSYELISTSGVPFGLFTDALTWGGGFEMWDWNYSANLNADVYGTTDDVVTATELYSFVRQCIISEYGFEVQTIQRAIPLDDIHMQDGSIPIFSRYVTLNLNEIARGVEKKYLAITN